MSSFCSATWICNLRNDLIALEYPSFDIWILEGPFSRSFLELSLFKDNWLPNNDFLRNRIIPFCREAFFNTSWRNIIRCSYLIFKYTQDSHTLDTLFDFALNIANYEKSWNVWIPFQPKATHFLLHSMFHKYKIQFVWFDKTFVSMRSSP